jgi:hypothetical protein
MKLQFRVVKELRWLLPRDAVFWMVPNGGDMTEAARKKAAGLGERAGASDLMLLYRGKLLCIELKVSEDPLYGVKRTTYQKPEQKAFQRDVEAAGGAYGVVRTIDDLNAFLALHGVPTRETALSASSMRGMVG